MVGDRGRIVRASSSNTGIVGSGALLALFIAGEFVLLARVFRASLLNAGQAPDLAAFGRMMRRAPA